MGIKLTQKDVKESFYTFEVGYCELNYILKGLDRLGYTCGVYGWNSDIYTNNNIAISTGYRPFANVTKSQNKIGREIMHRYEKEAEKIYKKGFEYNKMLKKIETLRSKMFEELANILRGV